MTVYYCLAIAMLLPLVLALSSIPFRMKQLASVDINEPRAQAEHLTGAGRRMVAAQKNAWEALILFTVSLFLAEANQVMPIDIALASVIFIIMRILHALFYVLGYGVLRFIAFAGSIGAIITIIAEAIF